MIDRLGELRPDILPHFQEYVPTSELETKAKSIAIAAHDGVFRKSGEPYWTHCQAVASILDEWGIDDTEIKAAAWVHDVVEDCPDVSKEFIEQELGERVLFIVDGVSKFISPDGNSDDGETHRKVMDRQYIDLGVSLVKIADRIHNMSTLDSMKPEKQREKAIETLEIYAPLAEALGMWDVRNKLQDISFMYLDPILYHKVSTQIDNDPRLNENFLGHYTSLVSVCLSENGVKGDVGVRVGGYYNLYKKRELQAMKGRSGISNFSSINDVVSLRVQVSSVADCYLATGAIHTLFGKDVDFSRYDEYIGGNKRDNGYEAIQTTVVIPDGKLLEIAVSTHEMESFNRWGVISKIKRGDSDLQDYLLKAVFVEGNGETVKFLHRGATGVDIAYGINDVIGASTRGIIVEGVPHPLTTVIPNAAKVSLEVGTSRRAPEPELANYCLPSTKRKIESQLTLKSRDELVTEGLKRMEQILSPRGYLVLSDLGDRTQSLLNNLQLQSLDDLYFYVGVGTGMDSQIENWLDRKGINKETEDITTIRISGDDQKGIMSELTSEIYKLEGNIILINMQPISDNKYSLRLVIQKLGKEGEEAFINYISSNEKFKESLIV